MRTATNWVGIEFSRITDAILLRSDRTMFTYASGTVAYATTWVALEISGGGHKLSPSAWKEFTVEYCILLLIGRQKKKKKKKTAGVAEALIIYLKLSN